jgi:hypothetical protein
LNNHSTVVGTLNISGYTNIRSSLEVLKDITFNYITCASSAIIGNTVYCNNHTKNTGDTINFNIFNTTNNFPSICTINSAETKINNSLNVSGATTLSSSLIVSGVTTLKYITTLSSSLNVSGVTTLNNATSCISSFNVSTLNNATSCISSLNVSGVTTLNDYTIINGNTQLQPKLLLSGQEYLIPAQTSIEGVALLLGLNRLNSRCLFIGDSVNLTQNATNSIISLNPTGRFDCTSTDGSLRLPAVFNGAIFTNATCNTTCISSLNVSGLTT